MLWNNRDNIKFVPIKEINSDKDYTVVNEINQLEWYVQNLHNSAQRHSNLLKAVKNSTETRIETQTLYFMDLKSGRCGFVQLLYSSVMGGIYKGFQLNFKSFRSRSSGKEGREEQTDIWESFKVDHIKEFSHLKVESPEVKFAFKKTGDNELVSKLEVKVNIPKQSNGTELQIDLIVDLHRGFMVNPDGCSFYMDKTLSEEDLVKQRETTFSKKMIRHLFIPRIHCRGTISYYNSQGNKTDIRLDNVPGLYIDAVQGLLPQKAANRWNFCGFQSIASSYLCMEFTTTEEYGAITVSVWCTTKDNQIHTVGSNINGCSAQFLNTMKDPKNGYYYPTQIRFPLEFEERSLALVNRYDIMGELPSIVKKLAENIAHIKPYIYQYCQDSTYNGESGISIVECTFISS